VRDSNTLERAVILADGLGIAADGLQLPVTKPDAGKLPTGMLREDSSGGFAREVRMRAASQSKNFIGKHHAGL